MAPDHPFPHAVYDCFRVYEFINSNIHKYFKINPKNIFVGGDSAGGALSCALTILAIKKGLRVPKGLHLVYPSLDARKIFYGSRAFILDDLVLWPSLINHAHNSYFTN